MVTSCLAAKHNGAIRENLARIMARLRQLSTPMSGLSRPLKQFLNKSARDPRNFPADPGQAGSLGASSHDGTLVEWHQMKYKDRPTAFVAMRFGDDHWRDKTYLAIREELEAAGYQVLRGDELKTSGPVVDEVCRLLREADFVVVDSSGDSHSVSYELGFCHGVGRSPERTLLLRNDSNLPFNYRHYRHRIYKDIRHLRRLLRDYLDISEPITDDMLGYAFTFEFSENAGMGYIMDGVECIFDALLENNLTGRCEIYSAEQFTLPGRFFTVAIALRLRGQENAPDYPFWEKIVARVAQFTPQFNGCITLDQQMSELSMKSAIKEQLLYCGAVEIRDGHITRLIDTNDEGNFVELYLRRKETNAV